MAHCKKLEIIRSLVSAASPIPRAFVLHAQKCKHAFFWLSAALGIKKAYYEVNRTYREDNIIDEFSCPKKNAFIKIVFQDIGQRHLVFSSARHMPDYVKQMFLEARKESSLLRGHINSCNECHDYYSAFYQAAVKFQRKYMAAIKQSKVIIPCTENVAYEINLAHVNYVEPKKLENLKPN